MDRGDPFRASIRVRNTRETSSVSESFVQLWELVFAVIADGKRATEST